MNAREIVPISVRRRLRRTARSALLEATIAGRKLRPNRPLPEYIIVGAQRCGTTSLFHALARHQAVMPNVFNAKGVHYFDTNYHQPLSWYRAHFPTEHQRERHAARVGHPPVVGEASPYYLFHPTSITRLRADVPDARLIVLLRDPVMRAISHYQHMVWEGHEPLTSLNEALDREADRLDGTTERLRVDPHYRSHAHQHFSYVARGQYAEQLERLFKHFPRDQVLVMATENLTADPSSNLAEIQRFVGLDPDPNLNLGRRNASEHEAPDPVIIERLREQFSESNARLREIVEVDLPWT